MRAAALFTLLSAAPAAAMSYTADPSTFASLLSGLQPGDTLNLQAGTYPHFTVGNLNGSASAWITVQGPSSGAPAVIQADPGPCCNTVEIASSSYVAVRNLTIDNNGVDGAFGISAKSGAVHHIRIENNVITFSGTVSQQTDGISTKVAAWDWEIRGNRIEHAGTGTYLGQPDGTAPFVEGIIEGNLWLEPVGYDMEIKEQTAYSPADLTAGLPTGPSRTLIRYNVFIKGDGPSPDGDRPNLLVDGFPATGPGSGNSYELYGNLFFHNPREALLQVSGSVSIHDNLFVDGQYTAISLQAHAGAPLLTAYVYNNTVLTMAEGISFSSAASVDDLVTGNLVFAATPISGTIAHQLDNLTAPYAMASQFVNAPVVMLPGLDLYPLPGKVTGTALDLSKVMGDVAPLADFNGVSKGALAYRGAYAGEGMNRGWPPASDARPIPDGGMSGAGGGSASSGGGGSASSGGGGSASSAGGGSMSGGGSASSGGGSAAGGGGAVQRTGACGRTAGNPAALLALAALLLRRTKPDSSN